MKIIFDVLQTTIFIVLSTQNLLPEKLSRKQTALLSLVLYLSILSVFFIGNYGLICMVISALVYLSLFTSKKLLNICCFLSAYIICIVSDNIVAPVLIYITKVEFKRWQTDLLYDAIMFLVILAVSYSISFISGALLKKLLLKHGDMFISKQYLLLIFINLSICLSIFAFNIIMGEKAGYTFDILLFNCIIFTVYFIVSTATIIIAMRSYISKTEAAMKQRSYEDLQGYAAEIETMYSDLRSFKHDYINIMSSMSGYIEMEDLDGLEQYFTEKIVPIREHVDQSDYKLNQLGNIHVLELKSILSSKLIYAHERRIHVEIDIRDPIDEISMDIIDLTRVSGIYMDNAIEAALESVHPELSLGILAGKNYITIVIENSFVDHGIPMHSINTLSVSSKGPGRGTGLYNAANIINKYPNVTRETRIKDQRFVQLLEISQ